MSRPLTAYRLDNLVCRACNWQTRRIKLEDGTYGTCNRCGEPIVKRNEFQSRKIAAAKADLERYGLR
jgi:RNA polymerase-binding transcription factor DksA